MVGPFLKEKFLIFLMTLKMGRFLYILHYVRQGSTTKLWKGVILTKPNQSVTMNTEAIRKPQKNEKEKKTRPQ